MIVELSREHLAVLLTGDPIEVADIVIRPNLGQPSRVLLERAPADAEQANEDAIADRVAVRRSDARHQLTGDPQFWFNAKFDGRCPHAFCTTERIERGDRVLRDAKGKKTYCAPCGRNLFPNVRDPRAVAA